MPREGLWVVLIVQKPAPSEEVFILPGRDVDPFIDKLMRQRSDDIIRLVCYKPSDPEPVLSASSP